MDLDTVKTRSFGIHRPDPELVDNLGDLIGPESRVPGSLLCTGGGVDLITCGKCRRCDREGPAQVIRWDILPTCQSWRKIFPPALVDSPGHVFPSFNLRLRVDAGVR